MSNFDEIRRIVLADPALLESFASAATEPELFTLVQTLGRSRGIEVTTRELEEIVRANRRAWLERWLA